MNSLRYGSCSGHVSRLTESIVSLPRSPFLILHVTQSKHAVTYGCHIDLNKRMHKLISIPSDP